MNKQSKGWLWGIVIGSVAGSVTALLLTPKSGRELRKDIADGSRQVAEKSQEIVGKVGEVGADLISIVKESADGIVREVGTKFFHKETEENLETLQVSSIEEVETSDSDSDK